MVNAAPNLPKTMRAARFFKYHDPYSIVEIPVPEPAPYELLLKTAVAGYCASDEAYRTASPGVPLCALPMTGSHEPTGTIVAMGDSVKGFSLGDRIAALAPINQCDNCDDCRQGEALFCDFRESISMQRQGAFSDYVIVDSRFSTKIPDKISFVDAAPLTCAGATIFAAIKRAAVPVGGSVAIVGIGGLGHLGVQFAKCMGYKVVGVDARDEPLDLARSLQFPPDLVLDARLDVATAKQQLKDAGLPGGVDAVITTGPPAGHPFAFAIVKKHGLIVLVGLAPVTLTSATFVFKDVRTRGSRLCTVEYFRELLELVDKHKIAPEIKTYKLEQVNEMAENAKLPTAKGKAVVVF